MPKYIRNHDLCYPWVDVNREIQVKGLKGFYTDGQRLYRDGKLIDQRIQMVHATREHRLKIFCPEVFKVATFVKTKGLRTPRSKNILGYAKKAI